MASRDESTLPATRRPKSRKSLAHIPSAQTVDKENMTADIGTLISKRGMPAEKKKTRSKSIGPGGLDALQDTAGNRRKSLASVPHPPPRSILKPTMPPLREIPAHISKRKQSPKKVTPPQNPVAGPLIDYNVDVAPTVTGADTLSNPFQVGSNPAVSETRVTLRTEEEQQAAAREREEKDRDEMQKEVNARRDARRKSLANRRVSFAPEATLHTWDVVVEYQDSTTSSSATTSTRRASNVTGGSVGSPHPGASLASLEARSTPDQEDEEMADAASEDDAGPQQKKRRRSSGIPPMNFNNPDDEGFSSSPFSGDEASEAEDVIEDDGAASNSDSDEDGTMMSIDGGGETTNMSMASVDSSGSSSARLEEALKNAANQAGTDYDDDGEIVASFTPWSNKAPEIESKNDQENLNPFSPAFGRAISEEAGSEDDEMTMDMTRAVGGILPAQEPDQETMSMDVTRAFGSIISNPAPSKSRRKSLPSARRQSSRRNSAEIDSDGEETMDLTMAIGSIQETSAQGQDDSNDENEEMTMEFTSVVGGVLPQYNASRNKRNSMAPPPRPARSRESFDSSTADETMTMDMDMDMTQAVGRIMPSIMETDVGDLEPTVGMEMTTALGGIFQPQSDSQTRTHAKMVMEMEVDTASSPFRTDVSPPKSAVLQHAIAVASETGSPSLAAFNGRSTRRSAASRVSTTPMSKAGTPVKKPTTPSKQLTPKPVRPTTPSKTPPSKNVVMRTGSPKKLFVPELKAASSTPQSSRKAATKLFQRDAASGAITPSFVMTPQRRLSSGIGLDRVGLGSPRIAAILDRRGSIGEQARLFAPSPLAQGVRFQDPRVIEKEIDQDQRLEQDREKGQTTATGADHGENEKDATLNLKEMMETLTPRKKPLKGRKSLHVGAAKGILGKRPIELDEDEEDEENDGLKRLKGHQGSPVKQVKLGGPPTKAETTGRVTRAARKSMDSTANSLLVPSISSSPVKANGTTPQAQALDKDVEVSIGNQDIVPFREKESFESVQRPEESNEDDRIQLQDFLNMTSIRFMELTTTKRRHTVAPKALDGELRSRKSEEAKTTLEDCIAAGAATIPMLELFQHACHELKNYISEGRKTVREIETETFEENPPLFREYISATADVKLVMDNQLKNVKTHSRLLSKGTWYHWRMTLLETLKDGLFRSGEGMIEDEEFLNQQQALLDSILPKLIKQAEKLRSEETDLQLAAEELANCDPEELSDARQQLVSVEADLEAKKRMIAELQGQLQETEVEIAAGTEKKHLFSEEIREAEKIREECRGWTSGEVSSLKAKVSAIEKEHGWTITGVSGTTTSMTYRKEIELVFDAASFRTANSTAHQSVNSRIDLWYIAAARESNPVPLTTEKDFLLQSIRDHVRGLNQSQTQVKALLQAVSSAWNKTRSVVDNIHLLNVSCPTQVTKTSDNSMLVQSSLLISPLMTKVEISFHLISHSSENGLDVEISPSAAVVYGEKFNEPKMREFLLNRLGNYVEEKGKGKSASWGAAVAELGSKLLARGKK